jgi:dTDP-4-amino-4,6-dideoxygalactose transaminase
VYYKELLSIYSKVVKVIKSCRTVSQYNSAVQYTKLYLKKMPSNIDQELRSKLIEVLNKQIFLIKYRYGPIPQKKSYQERN